MAVREFVYCQTQDMQLVWNKWSEQEVTTCGRGR